LSTFSGDTQWQTRPRLGTPKPAYRAFELLHGAGMERVAVAGACPCYQSSQYNWPTGKGSAGGHVCGCAPLAHAGVGADAAAAGGGGA
jgi:hypothetical protein